MLSVRGHQVVIDKLTIPSTQKSELRIPACPTCIFVGNGDVCVDMCMGGGGGGGV